ERLEDRTVLSPTVLDPNLEVRTVVAGLNQPTTMAFLRPDSANDFFVLEKPTGRVQRVINGIRRTVLDLAVNNAGKRGLLGIALSWPARYGATRSRSGPPTPARVSPTPASAVPPAGPPAAAVARTAQHASVEPVTATLPGPRHRTTARAMHARALRVPTRYKV